MRTTAAMALTIFLLGASAQAATISAPFSSDYTLLSLGSVPGVTSNYGGIAFLNNNTLLLGGAANGANGVIDEVAVTRDGLGNINGFGAVTQLSTGPYIDGGLAFGPGGDLFFTEYPVNQIGEILPGGTSPALTQSSNTGSSVGTLAFVPAGFNGAGNFVIGSYNGGTFCTASLTPDGTVTGTYDIGTCTTSSTNTTNGGPEGIIYVPQGSVDFTGQTALVSLYGDGEVGAYSIDSNGLPIASTFTPFITGLGGAEGAVIDPVTGDFLFSTFGGGSQIIEVQGFVAPPSSTPEPAAFFLMAGGLATLLVRRLARTTR